MACTGYIFKVSSHLKGMTLSAVNLRIRGPVMSTSHQLLHKPTTVCNNCQKQLKSHFSSLSARQLNGLSKGPNVLAVRYVRKYKGRRSGMDLTMVYYCAAMCVTMLGACYAAVPLYKKFCQMAGLGGRAEKGHDIAKMQTMEPVRDRKIHVEFQAERDATMRWNFRPMQKSIEVVPGETALAFFKAKNPTDKPITGVSTYTILPYAAALYFNKIQCFCFEEQRLNPHEEVELPVFFFIDPDYDLDINLLGVDNIMLAYTFYEAKEGEQVPLPSFLQNPVQHSRSTGKKMALPEASG